MALGSVDVRVYFYIYILRVCVYVCMYVYVIPKRPPPKKNKKQDRKHAKSTHLLDDAVEQLAPRQGLQHHVEVGGVLAVELVDGHHVRVVQPSEDVYLRVGGRAGFSGEAEGNTTRVCWFASY